MKKKIWISSTAQKQWEEKQPVEGVSGTTLEIVNVKKQKIRGFGGCFNELGKKALDNLSEMDRKVVFNELFGKENCNFNFCRMPVGANDFSEFWYSHNETENDFSMEHFSIERDYKYLIPYIKEAQKISKELEIFASPWSPPVWMKFPKAYNFGTLVWEENYLKAYALYFVKFIQAYEKENISINQLHIQNEPCSTQKFPSCVWTGEQFRDFIENYLADSFLENNIKTDIWLGTINGPEFDGRFLTTRYNNYANVVLESEKCRKYIKGIAYQWSGKYAIQKTHMAYPDLELIQSESECGDGTNTWEYAMYIFEMIHHYFINGASSYIYWNLALEEDNQSTWGWTQNSLVSVVKNQIKYNPEFYLMKHFSKLVKKGANVLKINGSLNANAIAFENPNGERVIAIMNPFKTQKEINIEGIVYFLEPLSFNTIVL